MTTKAKPKAAPKDQRRRNSYKLNWDRAHQKSRAASLLKYALKLTHQVAVETVTKETV
jgi:hypothetical protein